MVASCKDTMDVYMHLLVGGAVLLVSLPLGILCGCLHCKSIYLWEQKNSVPSHTSPVYEDVKPPTVHAVYVDSALNMTENRAYSVPQQ